jgi:AraC family transcriptional regulator of adaptative response / DNA-3-methyladenine glycosylase II
MTLDPDICYRAVASRDARFDGRFFTAVTTTGIYCRPICPARTPGRGNVRFYPCAAAAEEAGFRPCRRCRPETAPGSPAWIGTPVTVRRALRLIDAGVLDGRGADVATLAAHLGIGDRHLRRLFANHLGASPLAVAQTRRAHFARQLVDQTDLPLTRIAFAAGFGSVRRFNTAMLSTFGAPPSALRRSPRAAEPGVVTLRLPYRPPLAWTALLAFLRERAIPGVESVDETTYRRAARAGEATGVIAIRPAANGPYLELSAPVALAPALADLVLRARRLCDLDADPAAIDRDLRRDPLLAPRVRARPGLRVPGAWDRGELAVRAVLGQQVSVAAARTLAGRLAAALGEPLADAPVGGPTHLFPTPAALAQADLTRFGLTRARAAALGGLAAALRDGRLDLDDAADPDDLRARLEALPGIGPWTAQYVALRALGDPDAFPAGDLGVRKALATAVGPATAAAVLARAEAWRPWRAYATLHLWQSAD